MLLINFLRDTPGGNFIYSMELTKYIIDHYNDSCLIAISSGNLLKLSEYIDVKEYGYIFKVYDFHENILLSIIYERAIIKGLVRDYNVISLISPNTLLPFYNFNNVKITSVIHDLNFLVLPISFYKKAYKRALYKYTVANSDNLICISNFTAHALSKFDRRAKDSNLLVVYNGVKHSECNNFNDSGRKSDYCISFAHHSHKNTEGSIELIVEYNKINTYDKLRLKVVGDNNYVDDLKKIYKNLTFIDWVGYLPNDELKFELENARFLIFLSHYEGFGLPVLEAYSLRTPVVISTQQALVEISNNLSIVHDDEYVDTAKEMFNFYDDLIFLDSRLNEMKDYADSLSWDKTFEQILKVAK